MVIKLLSSDNNLFLSPSLACKTNNVQALVFTSTVNVVFGGQRIENGDESLPYFDARKVGYVVSASL